MQPSPQHGARADFFHEKPCPARIGPKATGSLPHLGSGAAAAAFQSVLSCTGHWSNIDVYLECPLSWVDVTVRLYAVTSGTRALIAETTIATSGMEVLSSTYRGIVLEGRGHPGSGWAVEASNPSGDTTYASATISAEVWGQESTPEGVGDSAAVAWPDRKSPDRAALMKGWDEDAQLWRAIKVNSSGELVIVSGATVEFQFVDLGNVSGPVLLDAGGKVTNWRMTLIGDVTITWANLVPGASGTIDVEEAGVGYWVIDWGADTETTTIEPGIPFPDAGLVSNFPYGAKTATTAALGVGGGPTYQATAAALVGMLGASLVIRGNFTDPFSPFTSGFEDCYLWQGPCVGAGPSVSGALVFQAEAGGDNIVATFTAPGAGPASATAWEWAAAVSWLTNFAPGSEWRIRSNASERVGFDATSAWVQHDAGGVALSASTFVQVTAANDSTVTVSAGSLSLTASGNVPILSTGGDVSVIANNGTVQLASLSRVFADVNGFTWLDAEEVLGVLDVTIGTNTGDLTGAGVNVLLNAQTDVAVNTTAGTAALTYAGVNRVLADVDGVEVIGLRVRWVDISSTPIAASIDRYYYAAAGSSVFDLPAGSAAIDGQSIGLANRAGGAMSAVANVGDTIDGAASYAVADKLVVFFTWHQSTSSWVASPGA